MVKFRRQKIYYLALKICCETYKQGLKVLFFVLNGTQVVFTPSPMTRIFCSIVSLNSCYSVENG